MMLRLVGVRMSGLVQGNYQINMFDNEHILSLYMAMDRMKNRFGKNAIHRASTLEALTTSH